jgi:beta-lactamase regulating signal transducer with metallopeptidase domain
MIDFTGFIDTWAATLWRASWQGGLTLLVVWVLCRLLPSMPARFQSWLWRLAILKFLVALVWFAPIEVPLLPAVETARVDLSVPAIPEDLEFTASPQVTGVAVFQQSPNLPTLWLIPCIAWTAGVAWLLNRIRKDWRDARHLRARCRPIRNETLLAQLASVSKSFGLRTPPKLLEMNGKGSPMLVGILRPAIIIPATTLNRLDPSERTMVLGHELAHIRRSDLFWNLVAAFVRAVFFFHPLVWFTERRLQLAQEIAADELAIARQSHEPASYGTLLVSIVSKLGPDRILPTMAVGTAGSQQSLKQRIVAMRFMKPVSLRDLVACGLVLAAVGILGIVPWKLVAAEPSEKILQLIKADDFWSQTGAKLTHEDIKFEERNALRELAGSSDDTAVRIRAFKLLADHDNRTRYSKDFAEQQVLEAVEGVFRHLETHTNDEMVAKFRPELGFTHITVSKRAADQGSVWVLIEVVDSVLPSGGLNIRWSSTTKTVNKIEHWGANRNPLRRPGVSVNDKDKAADPKAVEARPSQHIASIKISEGAQGKDKVVLASPQIVYVAGRKAEFEMGDKDRRIEASIEADPSTSPIEHSVQVKITDKPDSKAESILASPRIRLCDGKSGTIKCTKPDGNELEIVVTIELVKPLE